MDAKRDLKHLSNMLGISKHAPNWVFSPYQWSTGQCYDQRFLLIFGEQWHFSLKKTML
jgi:hypothetical protein